MSRRSSIPPFRHDIECEVDGEVHRGSYDLAGGMLNVRGAGGSKSATPGARPDVLAKIILSELVREAKREGWQ